MKIEKTSKYTIVETSIDKYLVLKNVENSEELIGKPKRIIFDNQGIIPEFEEREV